QPAVRDENVFAKLLSAMTRDNVERNAAEIVKIRQLAGREFQRDERRPQLGDVQPKLSRDSIAEVRRAELRKGQAAGRNDERIAGKRAEIGFDAELGLLSDVAHFAAGANVNVGRRAFREQQVDDLPRA